MLGNIVIGLAFSIGFLAMSAFAFFVLDAWYIAFGMFFAAIAFPIVCIKDKDIFKK